MESDTSVIPQLVESFKQKKSAFLCSSLAGNDCSNKLHTNNNQKGITVDEQTRSSLFTDTFCHVCGADLQFESQRVSHYEGKKHAQKVRMYFQMHRELDDDAQIDTKPEQINFQDDLSGKVDKNKFCSLCNMVFSSAIVAESHYVGKIHAKKIRKMGELVQKTPESFHLLDEEFTSKCTPRTSSADVSLSLAGIVEDSQMVKPTSVTKHTKNDIIRQEASDEVPLSSSSNTPDLVYSSKYCNLCSAPFTHPLMAQQHYTGKKHKRNEARKKMLEDLRENAVLSDSNSNIGVGNYICPICSVTLTSIEMYQSHMQGNKHQLKESIVVNLMKKSKKKYNSFQDELADYIKVQKARGLEPNVSFRENEDNGGYSSDEEDEKSCIFGKDKQNSRSTQMDHFCTHSEGDTSYTSVKNRLCRESSMHNNLEKVECKPKCHLKVDCSQDKRIPLTRPALEDGQDSSETDSSDCHGHVTSDSTGSCKRESRHSRKHRKEKRRKDWDLKGYAEDPKHKKKRYSDSDSEKEEEKHRHKKIKRFKQAESGDEDRVKQKKEGKDRHKVTVGKVKTKHTKHRREKKKKDDDKRTEEEMLWDESILGVC